jgi:hypothetical protein
MKETLVGDVTIQQATPDADFGFIAEVGSFMPKACKLLAGGGGASLTTG